MKRSVLLGSIILLLLGTTFYVSDQANVFIKSSAVQAQWPIIGFPTSIPDNNNDDDGGGVECWTKVLENSFTRGATYDCGDGYYGYSITFRKTYSCEGSARGSNPTCKSGTNVRYHEGCAGGWQESDTVQELNCGTGTF